MISVLCAIAVAAVLYAVLWQQVGSFYYSMDSDPTSRLVHLFGHLMIGLLAISFAAGIVAGSIEGSRPRRPEVRGVLAAIVFGVSAFALTVVGPSVIVRGFGGQPPVMVVVFGILLALTLLLFGAMGSALFCVTAAVGAAIGNALRRRSAGLAFGAFAFACCAALGLSFVQGALLRRTLQPFSEVKPTLEAHIDRDLVTLPATRNWRVRLQGDFPPSLGSTSLRIPGGEVWVRRAMDPVKWDAEALFTVPKGVQLPTRASALTFLRAHGIRESRLSNLRGNPASGWSSTTGKYRVSVALYDPRD